MYWNIGKFLESVDELLWENYLPWYLRGWKPAASCFHPAANLISLLWIVIISSLSHLQSEHRAHCVLASADGPLLSFLILPKTKGFLLSLQLIYILVGILFIFQSNLGFTFDWDSFWVRNSISFLFGQLDLHFLQTGFDSWPLNRSWDLLLHLPASRSHALMLWAWNSILAINFVSPTVSLTTWSSASLCCWISWCAWTNLTHSCSVVKAPIPDVPVFHPFPVGRSCTSFSRLCSIIYRVCSKPCTGPTSLVPGRLTIADWGISLFNLFLLF